MPPILDRLVASSSFRPQTAQQFFAITLARNLGDPGAAEHYAKLAADYPEDRLIAAFHRTMDVETTGDLGRRFHLDLPQVDGDDASPVTIRLLAVRVERRSVAVAVFNGQQLEYTQLRQLSSVREKAALSAATFINWVVDDYAIESAAVESAHPGQGDFHLNLVDTVVSALRERLLPLWRVSKAELFAAYGQPPLKSRKELRAVVTAMWPVLIGARSQGFVHDAVALGCFAQTQRVFLR